MASDKPKKKKKLKVNFTGVETRAHVPDGWYHAKVSDTSVEEGSQAQYIKWTYELMDPELKGRKVYDNTSLAPQSLWNLRNLLETLGVDTPDGEADLDLDSYHGLELMVHIENEVYEGKERPKVSDFKPLDETTSTEDDDEKPKKGDGKKEEVEEEEEDEKEEEEDEEDEKEDDDEEDEKEDKLSASEVREMDDAELKALVKKHGLRVDLDKIAKKAKRIAAVVDAMEAKDLLADDE